MNANTKTKLLTEWGTYIARAAAQGALSSKPLGIQSIEGVTGPRAGALEILAGMDAGALLRAFAKNDGATLRQFVPWSFPGDPQVYMSGRYVRVEAAWPDHLADKMIRLGDLGRYPHKGGRWIAGKNEYGQTIRPQLNDATPNFLVSGATGSGKSIAMQSAVMQLSRDHANRIVLLDGKYGESLRAVGHLGGVVGPVAVEASQMRAALGWAAAQMRRRYETGDKRGRVVVVFDEFQEFVHDDVIVELMKKLASQGRGARVHLLAATQHPTVDAFGDASTRRNLTGKLALKVGDPDASRVAVGGSSPRADFLLGAGDCYAVGLGSVHRVQIAYVDERDFSAAGNGGPQIDCWPDYDAEAIGQDVPQRSVGNVREMRPPELGAALITAMREESRRAFKDRVEEADLPRPGSGWSRDVLALARGTLAWLREKNVGLVHLADFAAGEHAVQTPVVQKYLFE